MVMEFVLNEQKALALGYSVESCYAVVDRLFAEYGVAPERLGFYRGPKGQAMFEACTSVASRLIASDWFLHVVEEWYWRVDSDEIVDREDCLASYRRVQAMNLV